MISYSQGLTWICTRRKQYNLQQRKFRLQGFQLKEQLRVEIVHWGRLQILFHWRFLRTREVCHVCFMDSQDREWIKLCLLIPFRPTYLWFPRQWSIDSADTWKDTVEYIYRLLLDSHLCDCTVDCPVCPRNQRAQMFPVKVSTMLVLQIINNVTLSTWVKWVRRCSIYSSNKWNEHISLGNVKYRNTLFLGRKMTACQTMNQ